MYNPFDLLLLFDSREFKAHWFETGSPAFLVDTLFERQVSSVSLADMVSTEDLLLTFDVDDVEIDALLFQTGYLTITDQEELEGELLYRLGYPNREVRQSLNRVLLRRLAPDARGQTANRIHLSRLLKAADCAGLREMFHAFFAGIPYQWYVNNDVANYEGYYASVFYSYFAALGYEITVEDSSGSGRLDMAVRAGGQVYLFEFKVTGQAGEGSALAQLRERDYAAKYRGRGAHSLDRRRVQPPDPQRDRLRGGRRLTARCSPTPTSTARGGAFNVKAGSATARSFRKGRRRRPR